MAQHREGKKHWPHDDDEEEVDDGDDDDDDDDDAVCLWLVNLPSQRGTLRNKGFMRPLFAETNMLI